MMNDQDRDLIAALAEGRLSTTDAEDAIARIESDPELAAEYAQQMAALTFLQSADHPQMTAAERSELHMNLVEQLGLVSDSAATPQTSKKKTPWWAPAFGLVTAAAVVTAIVILPGTGANDSSGPIGVASAELKSQSDSLEVAPTTESATESTPGEEESLLDETSFSVYETDSVDLDDLLNQADGADSPDAVTRQLEGLRFNTTIDLDSDQVISCINDLDTELPDGIIEILVIGADVDDEATIVHIGFDFGSGIEDGLSFVLDDCSLVAHANQG